MPVSKEYLRRLPLFAPPLFLPLEQLLPGSPEPTRLYLLQFQLVDHLAHLGLRLDSQGYVRLYDLQLDRSSNLQHPSMYPLLESLTTSMLHPST